MKCNVCENPEPLGVCCSALGAVSFAYCETCMKKRAEPVGMFHATFECCGEEVAEWVKDCTTYMDGEYVTWSQWLERSEAAGGPSRG